MICGGRSEEGVNEIVDAVLVLEDDNPYDKNAVRVDIEYKTVGYLSRRDCIQYRHRLKKSGYLKAIATCSAKIVEGWKRGGIRAFWCEIGLTN